MSKRASSPKPAPFTRRWLSVNEAAAYLSLHPQTVYDLIGRREIPAVHVGRAVRVDLRRLDERLEQQLERWRGRRR